MLEACSQGTDWEGCKAKPDQARRRSPAPQLLQIPVDSNCGCHMPVLPTRILWLGHRLGTLFSFVQPQAMPPSVSPQSQSCRKFLLEPHSLMPRGCAGRSGGRAEKMMPARTDLGRESWLTPGQAACQSCPAMRPWMVRLDELHACKFYDLPRHG